jgi:hypothetical protein
MRVISIVFLLFLLFGCGKENYTPGNFNLNDTIVLPAGQILHNNDHNISIYLDSVLYDTRCPLGFLCLWEGNAQVRFKFISNHTVSDVILDTYMDFQNDTIVNGYKITLVSLAPQPRNGVKTEQKEYKATIVINY